MEARAAQITLTIFEFTTLAIARLLSQAPLDLVILEVGLGGRFDAVNAFDADCAIITSIDIDHTEFLGPDRESIGREKAGILRAGKPAIVSDPVAAAQRDRARPRSSVPTCGCSVATSTTRGDRQQWNWAGRERRYNGLAYPALRGANQLLNASGVLAAFEALRERAADHARRRCATAWRWSSCRGASRSSPGQPTLVLDVAHNPHAVAALAQNLDQMGFYPRTHAVFGAMRDKDLAAILDAHGAARRPLALHRPAAAARRARRASWPRCTPRAGRRPPGPVDRRLPSRPRRGAARRPRARGPR